MTHYAAWFVWMSVCGLPIVCVFCLQRSCKSDIYLLSKTKMRKIHPYTIKSNIKKKLEMEVFLLLCIFPVNRNTEA